MTEKELRMQARKEEREAARLEKKNVAKATKKQRETKLFVLLLAPATLFFLVFVVWPVLYNVYLSFLDWNMVSPTKEFVGVTNYAKLVADAEFIQALKNSFWYIAILMVTIFAFPYFLSFAMIHLVDRGQQTYRSILFFPSLISLSVGSTVFLFLFRFVGGPINSILEVFGIEAINWFNTGGMVMLVMALIVTWKTFGYNLLIFLAAVLEVPAELIEAAKLEKASKWTIFWRIIFPLTSSTAFYVFVITFTYALSQVFTPISIITQGGPNNRSTNLVYLIYDYAFNTFQSGRAAATAVITLVMVLFVVVLYQALEKKVHYEN